MIKFAERKSVCFNAEVLTVWNCSMSCEKLINGKTYYNCQYLADLKDLKNGVFKVECKRPKKLDVISNK